MSDSFAKETFKEAVQKKFGNYENFLNAYNKVYGTNFKLITIKTWGKPSSTNKPNVSIWKNIAEILDLDIQNLFAGATPVKKIPVIGTVSCGTTEIDDYQGDGEYAYYDGVDWTPKLYCLIACGESMAPEIEDGDKIICDPDAPIQNGNMVHYTIGNESAVKIYFKDDEVGVVSFIPYNQSENFRTRSIRIDDDIEYKIVKVVAVNKLKFNNNLARLKLIGKA